MLRKMMDAMFGCRHSRYSFPLTIRAGSRRARRCHVPARMWSAWTVARIRLRLAGDASGGSQSKKTARSLVTKEAA